MATPTPSPSAGEVVRISATLTGKEVQILNSLMRTYGLNRSAALRIIINAYWNVQNAPR